MLMYLIAVLVLLAVGFYALSVGVTGHISVGEGPELAAPTRLLVIGIAIIAFGAAYLVYKQPRDGDDGLPPIPATASSPPESRGSAPMEAAEVASDAARPDSGAEAEATVAEEEEQATEAAPDKSETAEVAPTPAPEPARTAAAPVVSTGSTDGLSSAAAELEAKAGQRRRVMPPIAATAVPIEDDEPEQEVVEPTPSRTAALPAATASSAKTTRTRASTAREPRTRRTTRVYRGEPLLLHVHNSLGRGQSREQLTLLIEGKPVADIEQGHISSASCILANLSLKLGRTLKWDPVNHQVVGDPEANALLARPYRAPYEHPTPQNV